MKCVSELAIGGTSDRIICGEKPTLGVITMLTGLSIMLDARAVEFWEAQYAEIGFAREIERQK
jgi:hypothetical protein